MVHGPFGAGKSMLLVAAVHLFLAQRSTPGPLRGCRVAVAAHTNAAVDRVMCGLLESGITGVTHACLPALWSALQTDGCLSCFSSLFPLHVSLQPWWRSEDGHGSGLHASWHSVAQSAPP